MGNAELKEISDDGDDFVDELKPGTKLMHGQYEIEKFLNAGGFGITYLARDSLDRKIVIKECFPGAFCRRSRSIVQARSRAHQPELKSIVRLFVQEARSLSKLTHPNIVGVHQVFEDNDTAYMALDFVEGRDLLDTLEDPNHGLNPDQIKSILTDILGAVGFVHEQSMLHRDISPDNILIDENLRPVLIDFGAAREQATKQSRVLSALRVVKDGYSPQEFYIAGSAQDASSDLYALGASFYHLITGDVPANSQARLAAIASGENDPYVPLVGNIKGYDRDFLAALDMSLKVLPKDRVQSAQDWLDMMSGTKPVVAAAVAASGGEKKKSRVPMLMASVGVVALLGLVAVTQTDILNPAADAPAASSEAAAGETPVADVQASAGDEPAQNIELASDQPADASAIESPVVSAEVASEEPITEPTVEAVAPAVVEEPAIVEELAPSTEVASDVPATEPTPEVIAPVIVEELTLNTDSAPETPAADEPIVIAEPVVENTAPVLDVTATDVAAPVEITAEVAASDIVEPTEFVDFPPIAVTGLVDVSIRPVVRPETLGLVPLPTPDIIADEASTQTLPGFLANVQDIPSSETPSLALPADPVDVALETVAFTVDVPALVPGNEIVEVAAVTVAEEPVPAAIVETDDSVANVADREATGTVATVADAFFILSAWSVELPFVASEASPDTIAAPAAVAPAWVEEGVVIKSVNGTAVASIQDIQSTLRETARPGDTAEMKLVFEAETDGVLSTHEWSTPIRQEFQLLNGVTFGAKNTDGTWLTSVTGIPEGVKTDLVVGDELIAYMSNSTKFETRTALKDLLDAEVAAGTTQFSFAVNRNDSMWVAGLEYKPTTENN